MDTGGLWTRVHVWVYKHFPGARESAAFIGFREGLSLKIVNKLPRWREEYDAISHAAGSGAQWARPAAHHPFSELLPPCLGQTCRGGSQLMETGTRVTSQTIQPVMTGECAMIVP